MFLSLISWTIYLVGAIFFFGGLYSFLRLFFIFLFAQKTDYKKYGAGEGAWAVITGASDGIGKGFAQELAKKKFNIVLISRTESKLQTVAKELEENFNVATKIVAVDFAKATDSDYDHIKDAIQGLDIGVLVNNVGFNSDYPQKFLDESLQRNLDIIEVNNKATVRVTYLILPFLLKRQKSLILNLSSASSVLNVPLLSVYSASKSFMNAWSKCLYCEYKKDGVNVECLTPAFVVSNMSKRRKSTITIPSPNTYVASVLNSVGHEWIRAGYLVHELMLTFGSLIPEKIFIWQNKKQHEAIQKAYLRKQERLKKEAEKKQE